MIGRLIALLFFAREVAHRDHLKADTYAKHVALGEFYEAIVGKADEIAEAYQGRKGLIDSIPMVSMDLSGDSVEKLQKILEAVEKIRYTAVDKTDAPLQNLIDEAVVTFLTTMNKLKHYK